MADAVHIFVVDGDPERSRATCEALCRAESPATAVAEADVVAAVGRVPGVVVVLGVGSSASASVQTVPHTVPHTVPQTVPLDPLVARYPATPVVAVGPDDATVAVDAIRRGAWDYVIARPDGGHLDELRAAVRRTDERRRLHAERERTRADFLSMVTHDIKVPLTVILGYAEMLGDPEPPPDQVPPDVIARIRDSGEQIHALVSNLLDVSRIEAGRFSFDPRPFDLGALLAYALEQHGPSARRRRVTLALDAGPLPAVADEGQLTRLVANLLANAIKFTPPGGRVAVAAHADGDGIRLTVADTGRGIPAADVPHLFERYRRVREAKRTEGTGLGLFIVKTIVDAHGGAIDIASTPGVGTTFTVLLPAAARR